MPKSLTRLTGCLLVLASVAAGCGPSAPAVRQVTVQTACLDALGFGAFAQSAIIGDQQVWDQVRNQANSLLAEQTPDETVNSAVHELATAGLALVDTIETLASDPNATSGLVGSNLEALNALEQPLGAVQDAGEKIGNICGG